MTKYTVDEDLKLVIPQKEAKKLLAYVDACEIEVSGFADVEFDEEEMIFKVGEIYLLKQESSGAETEMDADTILDFTEQMIKKGKEQLPRLWWHSHNTMEAFFSATDEGSMEILKNDSFFVSLVTNHAHEFSCAVTVWNPFKLRIEELPVVINWGYKNVPAYIKKEVKRKVKKARPVPAVVTQTPSQGYISDLPTEEDDENSDQEKFDWRGEDEEREEGYSGVGGIKGSLYLPKDPLKAQARVDDLGLIKIWLPHYRVYAWQNPKTGQVWVDVHETLGVLS